MSMTPTAELVTVPSAAAMPLQTLRRHIQARHPNLAYWSRESHDAEHAHAPATDHHHQEDQNT